jgi:signal transduction histidine kinase
MARHASDTAPARLLTLFLVLAGIPLAALGWLGWRLLEQDRVLEQQRLRERLENGANLLARELDRSLLAWEGLLPTLTQGTSTALPSHTVALWFDDSGVRDHRGIPLPYYPLVPSLPETSTNIFSTAEAQEFRERNLAAAASAYRRLASTSDRRVRAGALMRLARCLRRERRVEDALAVYSELAAMGDVPVAGSPSALVAHRERFALFQMIGDEIAARREAVALASALWEGRYRVDRPTFEFFRESTSLAPPASAALDLAHAVEEFWPLWQRQAAGRAMSVGAQGRPLAAVWERTPGGTAAVVGPIDALLAATRSMASDLALQVVFEDASGRSVWGSTPADDLQATKTLRDIGLPWSIRVAAADGERAPQASLSRRNLMVAGFTLMVLVIAAASYFVVRAVNRELGVARLQSDFVATVSHEFRTPLTAMRHLTERLEEGDVAADRLPHYYGALGRETRRLHALVESLLDFGRMEAGRRTYQMEEVRAAELAAQVVDEFREQRALSPQRIECHTPPSDLRSHDFPVRADREAIALAIRNLLDNAVKYSPESSTVRVTVESRDALTAISVVDEGPGIPPAEQQAIFLKFVRGTAARASDVKGTGIGLAMADHIVRVHGGRLEVASEPGRGSRFTILLPAVPDRAQPRSRRPDG